MVIKKPDNASFRIYERIPLGVWEIRLNQIFDHEVGPDSISGLSFASRAQATYKISDTHRLGIESYNDFGNFNNLSGYENQAHTIGPVLKGKIVHGVYYETGYRANISSAAPEHSFKFFIGKSF